MKRFTAGLILSAATLAGPAAIGQSQLLPQAQAFASSAASFLPSRSIQSFDGASASSESDTTPRPLASFVMAFAFLGFVVLRRIGS